MAAQPDDDANIEMWKIKRVRAGEEAVRNPS